LASRVVIDIETVPTEWSEFDEDEQAYLLKYAESEEEKQEVIDKLGLYALPGRVVAIGMLNPASGKAVILAEGIAGEGSAWEHDGDAEFWTGNEAEILEKFWDIVKRYEQIVTFNGRTFDAPFLNIRSLVLGVPVSRNLIPNRYKTAEHLDLLDALTFFGITRRYSLDFYSKRLELGSAKSGMSGADVARIYREGRMEDIAKYCLADVRATTKILDKVEDVLGPVFR